MSDVVVHLGLGAFHRAHQAWYTQRATEGAAAADASGAWEIWAFTGRSPAAALTLSTQNCEYTLVERGPERDSFETMRSITRAHDGADVSAWRSAVADARTKAITLTVTEAGYGQGSGESAAARREHDDDRARLSAPERPGCSTAMGRLADGLYERWLQGGGPLSVVSCDNLLGNGEVARRAVAGYAEVLPADFGEWMQGSVEFVSTMVDRITPATTEADVRAVRTHQGWDDRSPVITEAFTEWVLHGRFDAGRPPWEKAGARFVDDITPYEKRKLWLLNGGHTTLALLGLGRGCTTVAEAMDDAYCRDVLSGVWSEARAVLPFGEAELDEAVDALVRRFTNARIEHRLDQIARGTGDKIGPRILDPYRARQQAGFPQSPAEEIVIEAALDWERRPHAERVTE